MRDQILKRWPYLVIAAAVLLVWGHTVTFGFVWDDRCFIEGLESIRSFSHVPEMFYSLSAQSNFPEGFVLFRPLRTLLYAVLFALGGGDVPKPWLFHLANIVWHAAASMLLYRVLLLAFEKAEERLAPSEKRIRPWMPLILALAFALHPVTSEVVCWAKSLDDLMATTFVLASCVALLQWKTASASNHSYWCAVLFFAMAVYSKESAVPFALFCGVLLLWKQASMKDALRAVLPFVAMAFLFVAHRHFVIGRTSQTAPISGTYLQTLIDTLPAVPIYARLLGGIPPFCIDYTYMKSGHPLTAPAVMIGLALVVLAIAASVLLFKPKTRLLGAGFLWLILFLLPVSNLIPSMQYCAERFLYLPLIGWIVVMGSMLLAFPPRKVVLTASIAVVVCWASLAWNRSWIWEDPVSLFVRSHIEGPTSLRVQDNAVAAAFAQPHMRAVFGSNAHKPGQPTQILVNLANESPNTDWASIECTIDQLYNLFPDKDAVIMAFAVTKMRCHKYDEGIRLFKQAVTQYPDSSMSWKNLAQAYTTAGQTNQALEALQRVVALEPNATLSWERLVALQLQQGDYAGAKVSLKKLQALQPDNVEHTRSLAEAESKIAVLSAPFQ